MNKIYIPDPNLIECQNCHRSDFVIHYHQNTQYVEKERNWVSLCPNCQKENDKNWEEMWEELNNNRIYPNFYKT